MYRFQVHFVALLLSFILNLFRRGEYIKIVSPHPEPTFSTLFICVADTASLNSLQTLVLDGGVYAFTVPYTTSVLASTLRRL